MKKRIGVKVRSTNPFKKVSALRHELYKSTRAVQDASRGQQVIQFSSVEREIWERQQEAAMKSDLFRHSYLIIPKKKSTFQIVGRHLADYSVKKKLGRGAPGTVARLEKSLVPMLSTPHHHHGVKQRRSDAILNAVKAAEMHVNKTADGLAAFSNARLEETLRDMKVANAIARGDMSVTVDDGVEYEAGTSIYFGSTIALQARHGGFLSYNSAAIKASAHKVLSNTRFTVKNSEDLTDIGVMKYGDALWLQAGNHDVLGAQYGTLVDQKREIQPALVSCKRHSMFKAQQYGRWIVLKRDQPMANLGQPVVHSDKIMLEQEWYFLASQSPYESSMYKTISNSDEAMRTKLDLFQPGEECSWKIHLVSLPTEDKTGELKRQLLLQQAKENIEDSMNSRYEKGPALTTSLHSKLPMELTDDATVFNSLHRKLDNSENQAYLIQRYRDLQHQNFGRFMNPLHFLSALYGRDSPVVRFKMESIQRHLREEADEVGDTPFFAKDGDSNHVEAKDPLERTHDEYWTTAQKVLLDTKTWTELPSAMNTYYYRDRGRKMKAALVLQKWIRRFLNATFDYERAMKKVDVVARTKLQDKLIARKKFLSDHAHGHERIEGGDNRASSKGGFAGARSGSVKMRSSSVAYAAMSTKVRVASPSRSASMDYSAMGACSKIDSGVSRRASVGRQSKSMSMDVGELSQLVGLSGVAAIINAAAGMGQGGDGRSPSIFQHTEIDFAKLPAMSQRTFSGPSLKARSPSSSSIKVSRNRTGSTKNNFVNLLGLQAEHEEILYQNQAADFESADLQVYLDQTGFDAQINTSFGGVQSQRPFTANAALRPTPSDEGFESEQKKTARKESQRRRLQKQKRLLCRSADRDYGLPKDLFTDVFEDVNSKIGLKFLRTMSSRYDDVAAKKKPMSAGSTRRGSKK